MVDKRTYSRNTIYAKQKPPERCSTGVPVQGRNDKKLPCMGKMDVMTSYPVYEIFKARSNERVTSIVCHVDFAFN